MRYKISGVVVALLVLLSGGLFLALDDEGPAQGSDVMSGPTPEDCRPVSATEVRPC